MSNNFNVSNMKVNTNAVFQSLDIKDGNANNKIDASIWNAFARQVGGKTIKSSINESNAIRSINAYLKRGGETVKRIICEFLGWDLHKAKQNVSEAEQMLQDAADGKYDLEFNEQQYDDKKDLDFQVASLPDGRYIRANFKEGEIVSVSVSTDTNTYKQVDTDYYGDPADATEVIFFNDGEIYAVADNIQAGAQVNDYYEVYTEGESFEKYKALAEKIFNVGQ